MTGGVEGRGTSEDSRLAEGTGEAYTTTCANWPQTALRRPGLNLVSLSFLPTYYIRLSVPIALFRRIIIHDPVEGLIWRFHCAATFHRVSCIRLTPNCPAAAYTSSKTATLNDASNPYKFNFVVLYQKQRSDWNHSNISNCGMCQLFSEFRDSRSRV